MVCQFFFNIFAIIPLSALTKNQINLTDISNKPWLQNGAHSPFAEFACNYYTIPSEAVTYINEHTSLLKIPKGTLLVKPGDACEYLYLVCKGVLRGYSMEGKRQITTWITAENELVTSIRSFDFQQPARENIEAIEDCTLVSIHYGDLHFLYETYLEMNVIARKVLEQYYRDAEERAFISRLTKATEKYRHFLINNRDLHNRIPLKYIASYLGITVETLSRVRARKMIGGIDR